LGEAVRACDGDVEAAFAVYERARVPRTARVVLLTREMGRIYHAKGVERLVRNELWRNRTPSRYYDALEWLYSWRVDDLALGPGAQAREQFYRRIEPHSMT